jgi:hypothetical protein
MVTSSTSGYFVASGILGVFVTPDHGLTPIMRS